MPFPWLLATGFMIQINPGFFLNSSTKMWYSDGSSNVVGKKSHLTEKQNRKREKKRKTCENDMARLM